MKYNRPRDIVFRYVNCQLKNVTFGTTALKIRLQNEIRRKSSPNLIFTFVLQNLRTEQALVFTAGRLLSNELHGSSFCDSGIGGKESKFCPGPGCGRERVGLAGPEIIRHALCILGGSGAAIFLQIRESGRSLME